MKGKKTFIIPAILILGIATVFAAWAFSYNNSIQGNIVSAGGVLLISEEIYDFTVDTVNESVNNSQNLTLYNKNGLKLTTLNLTIDKVLNEPSCPNWQNDCNTEFRNQTSVINDGETIALFSGFNNFTLETMCVQYSCGQNISIEVDIQ